jgi:predicted nuclease of predicted toxin-antitoxin system
VKLLFDQNLSRFLVDQLEHVYPGSTHVARIGLGTATDREVWQYAGDHGLTIVSKDSDFSQLAFVHGAPPKVVWLRVGNAPTSTIKAVLLDAAEVIAQFTNDVEDAVLVLPVEGIAR